MHIESSVYVHNELVSLRDSPSDELGIQASSSHGSVSYNKLPVSSVMKGKREYEGAQRIRSRTRKCKHFTHIPQNQYHFLKQCK